MFTLGESNQICHEIEKLLQIGAIEPCQPTNGQFLSSIFLHPKADGSWRFILNLKNLNKFVHTVHFKLEDVRTATKLMTAKCFMATIDIKNAYYLLSILKQDRKYLRFKFKDSLFEFTCLPFGLSTAPYVFTKVLKPVMSYLRSLGFLSVIYLDDILCFGNTITQCTENVSITQKLLIDLGFIINREKSCLTPKQECKFLGFILNSVTQTISLPDKKRKNILEVIQKIRSSKKM